MPPDVDRAAARRESPTNDFRFGNEHVQDQGVHDGAGVGSRSIAVDVEDYMERGPDGPEGWIVDDAGLG